MNRYLIVCLILLATCPAVFGQKLAIGDKLPASVRKKMDIDEDHQYPLTILDFWSHSCAGCLESFPKINQYGKTFGDSLKIVLINREPVDSTQRFFEQRHWITRPEVQMVSGGLSILEQFNVWGLPFVVWLDSTLTIRGLEGGDYLSEKNIRRFLNGEGFSGETYGSPKKVSSLFDKEHEDRLLSFSYLARTRGRTGFSSSVNKDGLVQDIGLTKQTKEGLFRYAYEESGKYNFQRSWQMRAGGLFDFPSSAFHEEERSGSILYDYALKLPEADRHHRFKRMREDLDRYFGVRSRIDTLPVVTAVLVATENNGRMKSKGGDPKHTFRISSRSGKGRILGEEERVLVNQPYERFSRAIKNLIERHLDMPFVDDSGMEGNVDVSFDYLVFEFFTMELLQEALVPYGLTVEERVIPTPILVIERRREE